MALDPSIFNQVGRVNVGEGISNIIDQQRQRDAYNEERQNRLSAMANQQQAAQQAQAQKRNQELNMWLSSAVQSGRAKEEVMREAIAKGAEIGVSPETTQNHVMQVFASAKTPQERSDVAFTQAYPELVAKQRAERMFAKPAADVWETVNTKDGYVQVNRATGDIRPLGISPAEKLESSPPAYFTPVQTEQGVMAFNARTGRVEPVMIGGKPIIGTQSDVSLQERLAGAKERGKTAVETQVEAKKAIKKSDQLLSVAQQAKELLEKGPTGSGVGALVDVGGRLVGTTSESAQLASELETVSGWMVSNVPRMEGPQSNIDVLNYQTMAAKVGDRTVPVKERLRALDTLVKLQGKYKHLNQEVAGGEAAQASAAGSYDADKEARYQEWKAKQGR